jgi:hypothetical protein
MRAFLLVVILALSSACAPALHLTRPTPPEGDFGNVRTLSVTVSTDLGKAVENAVVTGLVLGEVPVPIPVDRILKERLVARLQALGYGVCGEAPCGDGAMTVRLTESSVGTEFTGTSMRSNARITAKVVVMQNDGQTPYDFNFWDRRSGRVEEAPLLVQTCADTIAARFEATLRPGRQASTLPLRDGGPLSPGVNMLLSDNWNGAIAFFSQLTQQQPDLDGAWYDLGVAWEAQGDWGQALAAYEQAAARSRRDMYVDAVQAARRMAPAQPPQPQPMAVPPQIIPVQ